MKASPAGPSTERLATGAELRPVREDDSHRGRAERRAEEAERALAEERHKLAEERHKLAEALAEIDRLERERT